MLYVAFRGTKTLNDMSIDYNYKHKRVSMDPQGGKGGLGSQGALKSMAWKALNSAHFPQDSPGYRS